jgi:hypothetical protein
VEGMYCITTFAPILPEQLAQKLKGLRFKITRKRFEWSQEGHLFAIEPFIHQPRGKEKAYRVYANGLIDGISYMFDMSLGWVSPSISGVEYVLKYPSYDNGHWQREFAKRPSFKIVDSRGIYHKDGVLFVIVNNEVRIQLRPPKAQKLNLIQALRKVDSFREELQPKEYDLFSLSEREGIA